MSDNPTDAVTPTQTDATHDALELMRRGYGAAGRQEGDFLLSHVLDPDLVLHEINLPEYPWGRVLRGAANAVAESQGTIGRWFEPFAPIAEEFYGGGHVVLVVGHYLARVRRSGEELRVPFVHHWQFRNGRAIEGRVYTDTAKFDRALNG